MLLAASSTCGLSVDLPPRRYMSLTHRPMRPPKISLHVSLPSVPTILSLCSPSGPFSRVNFLGNGRFTMRSASSVKRPDVDSSRKGVGHHPGSSVRSAPTSDSGRYCAVTNNRLQPWIHRLALHRKNAENAFMDSSQRLSPDEAFQRFDTQCKFSECHTAFR
jgi:hypothetical protein